VHVQDRVHPGDPVGQAVAVDDRDRAEFRDEVLGRRPGAARRFVTLFLEGAAAS
jgi:hypothetical protein